MVQKVVCELGNSENIDQIEEQLDRPDLSMAITSHAQQSSTSLADVTHPQTPLALPSLGGNHI